MAWRPWALAFTGFLSASHLGEAEWLEGLELGTALFCKTLIKLFSPGEFAFFLDIALSIFYSYHFSPFPCQGYEGIFLDLHQEDMVEFLEGAPSAPETVSPRSFSFSG